MFRKTPFIRASWQQPLSCTSTCRRFERGTGRYCCAWEMGPQTTIDFNHTSTDFFLYVFFFDPQEYDIQVSLVGSFLWGIDAFVHAAFDVLSSDSPSSDSLRYGRLELRDWIHGGGSPFLKESIMTRHFSRSSYRQFTLTRKLLWWILTDLLNLSDPVWKRAHGGILGSISWLYVVS